MGCVVVSALVQGSLLEPAVPRDSSVPSPLGARRNTKVIGDISELRVAVALCEAGYVVSKPLGENQRYDFVADDGERLLRVQVKTGRIRRGVVLFAACSTHGHRNRAQRPYHGEIDLLAVYAPQNGKVYLVPESHLTKSLGSLRIAPAKNNVAKTVRWADQYELA